MSTLMVQRRDYDKGEHITDLTAKAKDRYHRVHTYRNIIKKLNERHTTHYRKGRSFSNYQIRLPKQWGDGLDLHNHDVFEWSIVSYDPVVLQLRKLGDNA